MDARGRITLPDVVFLVFALAMLAALVPVFMGGFTANLGEFSTGESYLFQLILPFAILVLLAVIWRKATAGVGR